MSDKIAQSYIAESVVQKTITADSFKLKENLQLEQVQQETKFESSYHGPNEANAQTHPTATYASNAIHTAINLSNITSMSNVTIIIAPRQEEPERLILKIPKRKHSDE
jgi:hypothetical protein